MPPRRRRRTSAQERGHWVEAWKRSDQTQEEFAATNGLSVGTLRNWIRGQRQARSPVETPPAFREMSIGDFLSRSGQSAEWEAEIRLPSGVVIAVTRRVSAVRVKELVEALRC